MMQTTVGIDGMMCEMCEAHINDAVRRNFDVKSVKSNHRKKSCVIVSEEELDGELLKKTIDETGYEFLSVSSEPYERKGLRAIFARH